MKVLLVVILILIGTHASAKEYFLNDFYQYNAALAQKTDSIFNTLIEQDKVAQMIVAAAGRLGKPDSEINRLIREKKLGGIIMLNGTKQGFVQMIGRYKVLNKGLPLVFSADAEPTLIGSKIKGTNPVKKANEMISREEVVYYTKIICKDLKQIGIQYNYAPVVDMSPNKTVSKRSFGLNADTAQIWSNIFIQETQKNGIVATAKHFPGHGYVKGDTHEKLVFIDGELKEVNNYIPLIKGGVISIMIAHIAIKNNVKYQTNGLPSSCSKVIVTDLLKNKMGFNGLVITDALNMGGVVSIPNCELKAAKAGCDILLMPVNEDKAINDIINEMKIDPSFKQSIYASVKKIIRLKICLGLID